MKMSCAFLRSYFRQSVDLGLCVSDMDIIRCELMQHNLPLQVLLPLFCYCQLDNFAWGTRGIDATETAGEGINEIAEKKAYEVPPGLSATTAHSCLLLPWIVCAVHSLCYCILLLCWRSAS